jgi:cytochrome c556
MTRKMIFLIAMLSGVSFGSAAALADGDADAAIAYRKSLMQVMSSHLKDIAAIVKGTVPFSANLSYHADGLVGATGLSLKTFEAKVLEGKEEKTTVKPEIWSDFARFTDAMHKTETDAAALKAAVDGGDKSAIASQLAAVGKDCKSCHDDTRTK